MTGYFRRGLHAFGAPGGGGNPCSFGCRVPRASFVRPASMDVAEAD
jgi:hypothetical protein